MARTRSEILKTLKAEKIRFMRLQFTDILGSNKNVEVPHEQFEKALDGEVMFDGSSIEGFSRIEESDMLLKPDLDTFTIFPWADEKGKVARLMCDVYNPDETPFDGCPRLTLKRSVEEAKRMGYTMMVAAHEALRLTGAAGIAPEVLRHVLEATDMPAMLYAPFAFGGPTPLPPDAPEAVREALVHTYRLGYKDVSQALALAERHGIPVPAAEAARSGLAGCVRLERPPS